MKVLWLHNGTADMASYRYRVLIPSQHVQAHGIEVSAEGDIVVFSKPSEKTPEHIKTCAGTPVVVDICDDHFDRFSFYTESCMLADYVTCSTKMLADRIKIATGRDAVVIGDPYEVEKNDPHAQGHKFIWFGHQVNLPALQRIFPMVDGIDLRIVTGATDKVPHRRWSLKALNEELRLANIALFPTIPEHGYKSPNRLVNAIRAGLFAICEKSPAYAEFDKFVWVGDLVGGFQWTRAFLSELNDRVAEGQQYVEANYSPEVIGKQWADLFASI